MHQIMQTSTQSNISCIQFLFQGWDLGAGIGPSHEDDSWDTRSSHVGVLGSGTAPGSPLQLSGKSDLGKPQEWLPPTWEDGAEFLALGIGLVLLFVGTWRVKADGSSLSPLLHVKKDFFNAFPIKKKKQAYKNI